MLDVWWTECYWNRIAVVPNISVCPCQLLHQFNLIFFTHLFSTLLNLCTESIGIDNSRGGGACIFYTTLCLSMYFFHKMLKWINNFVTRKEVIIWDLHFFLILCSVELWFLADLSGHHIVPIFKDHAVFLDCLTLEDGTDGLCRYVCKKLPFNVS
jgi:hypothetical protein